MAKLLAIKCSLIILQLVSLSVASVIIIIYYNPWIKILIDANGVDSGDKQFVEQFRGIEGEEIVIFIMCLATMLVSVLGIIGAVRGQEHNHCLLNFYMTTLIIFLFITFVALCGTIWELINKLLNRDSNTSKYVSDDQRLSRKLGDPAVTSVPADTNMTFIKNIDLLTEIFKPTISQQPLVTSWWYITKSFIFILISATIYATSVRLTRKILDSADHYLDNDDDSGRHFNIDADLDDTNHSTKDSSFTRV